MWWTDLVNAALVGYLPAAQAIARRGVARDLAELRPRLRCDDAEFRTLSNAATGPGGSIARALSLSGLALGRNSVGIDLLDIHSLAPFARRGQRSALTWCSSRRSSLYSDRGVQYASHGYREALDARGIECRMSRRANCWDNAVAESFFGTFKNELIYRRPWLTRKDARDAIVEYIEIFYNRIRRHSTIGYVSPVAFEEMDQATRACAA